VPAPDPPEEVFMLPRKIRIIHRGTWISFKEEKHLLLLSYNKANCRSILFRKLPYSFQVLNIISAIVDPVSPTQEARPDNVIVQDISEPIFADLTHSYVFVSI